MALGKLASFAYGVRAWGWRRSLGLACQQVVPGYAVQSFEPLVNTAQLAAAAGPAMYQLQPAPAKTGALNIAWVIPPPSPGSGGHQNLMRFVAALEGAGHNCTIYIYDWQARPVDRAQRLIATRAAKILRQPPFPPTQAAILPYAPAAAHTDLIMATSWETAYPVRIDPHAARRGYFVQDYEPWFYPAGDNALLAENTYRFGFHGFTAGRWLPQQLAQFGMTCSPFDFAADAETFRVLNQQSGPRDGVFVYARPQTPRRGFVLTMAALELFHRRNPDIPLHIGGGALPPGTVSFPHTAHPSLGLQELNQLYNRCQAALVISLSNMSLLPLELVAAGVIPVVNDADNTRLVAADDAFEFSAPTPPDLAAALERIVRDPAAQTPAGRWQRAAQVASSTPKTWAEVTAGFVDSVARYVGTEL